VFTATELPELLSELKKRFCQPSWTHDVLYTPPTVASGKKLEHKQIQLGKTSYKLGQEVATRVAFGQALCEAGKNNKQLVCLDAEVSNSTDTAEFAARYPDQFVECFIAEQNMVGVGMGMAALGDVSLISTFGCFLTRAHDQLRMAAISQLPLRVVGSHAGTEVGADGPSQMALEDIALFRSLPNSIVLYPCDAVSCHYLTELMLNYADGISYLRTTRGVTPVIYDNTARFTLGGFNVLCSSDHDQAVIIGSGITVYEALKAHETLKQQGVAVAVIDLYCVKPLDINSIRDVVARSGGRVITVEDHYRAGGVGEVVSAALIGTHTQLVSLAITNVPRSGTAAQLRAWQKIDAAAIKQAALSLR
jgi:transketolase